MKNVKMKYIVFICLLVAALSAVAQDIKLPLEIKRGHLSSVWTLDEGVETRVFLESAFPKIVFDETFVNEKLRPLGLHITEAPENVKIRLWGDQEPHKVTYLIEDSLCMNGRKLAIDALVMDFSKKPSWSGYDMVFPVSDLEGRIELNIREAYMRVLDDTDISLKGFTAYEMSYSEDTKGLYFDATMTCYDAKGGKEELSGRFLFDLGSGSAFVVNKNRPEVTDFVERTRRMWLDPSKYKPMPHLDLTVIRPEKIQVKNIEVEGSFVAAMKIASTANSDPYVGIIGNRFFEMVIILFDFENNKVYIKSNSSQVKVR